MKYEVTRLYTVTLTSEETISVLEDLQALAHDIYLAGDYPALASLYAMLNGEDGE